MSTIAAIGDTHAIEGFALVGVSVIVASTESAVRDAWRALPADVGLLILSPASSLVLTSLLHERPRTLPVTMP